MSKEQQTTRRKPGTPGAFSLWMQRTMNARTVRKIRRGKGQFMGMDMLILHTIGRQTGQPRETPVSWYADAVGDAAGRLVVASGGGSQNPGWHANLLAHPDQASIELPGSGDLVPVTPRLLEGDERKQAWEHILETRPQYEKYQRKSERQYPVIRLSA